MKKITALALVLVLAAGLTGCFWKNDAASPSPSPTPTAAPTNRPSPSPTAAPTDAPAPTATAPDDLTTIDWGEGQTVSLKVWGSQDDQKMLGEMIEAFKETYSATTWDITLAVVGENDSRARFLEDPAAAADVFSFPNDQLRDLVSAGALYELSGIFKESAVAENGAGSVGAATLNDKLWAFPMTSDNGYFLYYDKSVISENDVKTLDGILAAADDAGKKVFMNVDNGWYIASFFLGAGCALEIDEEGNQLCDFNNANGLAAAETIKAFTAHNAYINGDDAVLTGGFDDGSIVAGVSGIWNAEKITASLGENYAATKLPAMTLGGKQVQMSSFGGYKLIGINSQTAFPDAAMLLGRWLTNEQNQIKRFNDRQMGPSNVKASGNPAVKENIALAALSVQSAYAVSQNDVLGKYWEPAAAFGTAMISKDYSKTLQEQLDAMVSQIIQ